MKTGRGKPWKNIYKTNIPCISEQAYLDILMQPYIKLIWAAQDKHLWKGMIRKVHDKTKCWNIWWWCWEFLDKLLRLSMSRTYYFGLNVYIFAGGNVNEYNWESCCAEIWEQLLREMWYKLLRYICWWDSIVN